MHVCSACSGTANACLKSCDFTWPCCPVRQGGVVARCNTFMYRCTAMMLATIVDRGSGLRHLIRLLCWYCIVGCITLATM